jgi:ankyrin repeat protein
MAEGMLNPTNDFNGQTSQPPEANHGVECKVAYLRRTLTGLHVALLNGFSDVVTTLLREMSHSKHSRTAANDDDQDHITQLIGATPLMPAVERSHESIVRILLRRGADANGKPLGQEEARIANGSSIIYARYCGC